MSDTLQPERVLVTGSNSFTGSHMIQHVLEHTDCQVVGISRSPEYDPCMLPYRYRRNVDAKRFTFHELDLNRDWTGVQDLIRELQPDVVLNFAAQGEVRNSWKWPEQWYETNCMAVVRLTEFLRAETELKRYVAISTPEVYGSTGVNMEESHSYQPSTPYGASKLAGDLHVGAMARYHGFPAVFTRSANLYGIHQQLYRIIPRSVIYMKMGKTISLHGGGLSQRAFIHARDVADLTWKAVTKGRNGEAYHCAPDGELISIRQVVETIADRMGVTFDSAVEVQEENFGQDAIYSMSSKKAQAELGWKPQVSFEDGVAEVIEWVEENWETIQSMPLDYIHKP